MKVGLIYKATSKTTHKVYIGQTINTLKYRVQTHRRAAKVFKNTAKFYNAIRKYDIADFEWEILHKNIPESQLNYLECLEIIFYDSFENGYNSTQGGDHNPMDNPESREKMRRTLTGRIIGPFSANHREKLKISNELYWRIHPEETHTRAIKANSRIRTQEERNKISNSLKTFFQSHPDYMTKITTEEVIKIRQMFLEGKNAKEIKQHLGLSSSVSSIKGIANGNHRVKVQEYLKEVRELIQSRRNI